MSPCAHSQPPPFPEVTAVTSAFWIPPAAALSAPNHGNQQQSGRLGKSSQALLRAGEPGSVGHQGAMRGGRAKSAAGTAPLGPPGPRPQPLGNAGWSCSHSDSSLMLLCLWGPLQSQRAELEHHQPPSGSQGHGDGTYVPHQFPWTVHLDSGKLKWHMPT